MAKFYQYSVLTGIIVIMTGGLSACGSANKHNKTDATPASAQNSTAKSPTTNANSSDSLLVAVEANSMPFVFRDDKGAPTGFDIDVMNAIAEDQKLTVSYNVMPFDQLFTNVANSKVSLALAGISITDERKKTNIFSTPYFHSHQVALVNDKLKDKKSFAEFKGSPIAVQDGTISQELADKLGLTVTKTDTQFNSVKSLVNGQVDGIISDIGIMQYYQKQYKDKHFSLVEDATVVPDDYGILVKPNDSNLLNKINTGIDHIQKNGKYQQIHKKWFGA